jgi:hypothetical protein
LGKIELEYIKIIQNSPPILLYLSIKIRAFKEKSSIQMLKKLTFLNLSLKTCLLINDKLWHISIKKTQNLKKKQN